MKKFSMECSDINEVFDFCKKNYIFDNPKLLIQIFVTVNNYDYIKNIQNTLSKKFKFSHIIGCVSANNILNENETKSSILVSFSFFEHTHLNSGLIKFNSKKTSNISKESNLVFLYSTPDIGENYSNLHDFLSNKNKNHIIGGISSEINLNFKTFVFDKNNISTCGAVFCELFNKHLIISKKYSLGWETVGKEMIITKTKDDLLLEIDNLPALDVFTYYLGEDFIKNLPYSGVEFPIIIKNNNITLSRTIIAADFENKGLLFLGNLQEGDKIKIGYGDYENILKQSHSLITDIKNTHIDYEANFIFSCLSRKIFLEEEISKELSLFKNLNNVQGFFTFGEFFTSESGDTFLFNQSLTIVSISENYNISTIINNKTVEKPVLNQQKLFSANILKNLLKTTSFENEQYINQIKVKTNTLENISKTNNLTSLQNRFAFEEFLKNNVSENFFIAILNIDNFKYINDTYGYDIGDEILIESSIFFNSFKPSNFKLFHLNGDEFLFLSNNCTKEEFSNVIHNIQEYFHKHFLDTRDLFLNISAGGISFGTDTFEIQEIIKLCSISVLKSKEDIKTNLFIWFDNKFLIDIEEEQNLYIELKDAILFERLEVAFQPQIDSSSNYIIGIESLVRWNFNGKNIFPDKFIPLAEKYNLIYDLDKLIISKSCKFFNFLIYEKGYTGTMSVNASIQTLNNINFPNFLKEQLEKYQIPDHRLEVEITENIFINDIEHMFSQLKKISEFKVLIALDDFGTGFSSFSYLTDFPINKIKIDKSFIFELPFCKKKQNIVKSILYLAKTLDLKVIAEGAEDIETIELLSKSKCFNIQGYFFSKPLFEEDFLLFYQENPVSKTNFIDNITDKELEKILLLENETC